jgi:branched-chain amino acid transport system permease protein
MLRPVMRVPHARSISTMASTSGSAVVAIALVVIAQVTIFPMPVGVWVQGVILGLLGAMMAVGLGMVYRLNQVVNFAQGDMGSAPAVLAVGLVGFSGVNYFLGLATGLVAVVILSVIIEVVVIRRFARSPRLMLTVATIGLSQALVVVSLLIPDIWGQQPIATAVAHFPWHLSIHISPAVLTADDVVAVVVSLAALGGVALWFRSTDLGIATRAAGDRRDRAAMLGIPVNRLQTLTWVVAGLLSFLSVFLKATILGLPLDPTFGLTALASALGALAIGGFTELPAVAVAAVAIGTLEQGVAWSQPNRPTLVLAVIAAVVVLGVFMRQLIRQSRRASPGQWALAAGIRDAPAALLNLVAVRSAALAGSGVLIAFFVTLPLWLGPSSLLEVSNLLVLAVVGCSIVVLTGWGGQVTLGQMSFAAVGAVIGAVALVDWHWDLSLALLLAGSAGAAVAYVVGIPTLRLEGVFVAVTTLAFGLAASGYLLDRAEFSWIPNSPVLVPRLFGVPIVSESSLFLTCLGVAILVVVGMRGLRHSRFGRVLRALSTNERAAAGFGVDIGRAKLGAFAVSGFVAGIAGCLLVLVNQQYIEAPFAETASLAVFTATAVGGLGSVVGAVIGAALVEGSAVFLPPSWQLFPSAIGILVVLIAFPDGLSGLVFAGRDKFLVAMGRRHGLSVGDDLSFGAEGPAGVERRDRPGVAGAGVPPGGVPGRGDK